MMLIALLAACSGSASDDSASDAEATDLRVTEADLPALADDQFVWWGPEVVVQPYEDVMYCVWGTYEGEDVGLTGFEVIQSPFGHHLQLMGTTASAVDHPDGEVADCTSTEALGMEDMEPMILQTASNTSETTFGMPEGMAVKLDGRQRWVLQSHWINASDEPVRLQDAAVFTSVPETSVEQWAAPLIANRQGFELPPGEATTETFDCTYDQDYTVLYLLGHMHEWGTSFSTDLVTDQGTERLYDIPEWEATYRDAAPQQAYGDGELVIPAGATLRTTCNWFNDTDETITFPHEMCTTVTMVYPSLTPVICSD